MLLPWRSFITHALDQETARNTRFEAVVGIDFFNAVLKHIGKAVESSSADRSGRKDFALYHRPPGRSLPTPHVLNEARRVAEIFGVGCLAGLPMEPCWGSTESRRVEAYRYGKRGAAARISSLRAKPLARDAGQPEPEGIAECRCSVAEKYRRRTATCSGARVPQD